MAGHKAGVITGSTGDDLNRLDMIKNGRRRFTEKTIVECLKRERVTKAIRLLVDFFEHVVLELTSIGLVIGVSKSRFCAL